MNGRGLWHVHQRQYEGTGARVWLRNHSLQVFLLGLTVGQTVVAAGLLYLTWRWSWDAFRARETPIWPAFVTYFGAHYLISLVADSYGAWLQVWATGRFADPDSPQAH